MPNHHRSIAILTGGGDVPGLNPAIRAITIRALREGYKVYGIRRGWGGLVDLIPDDDADNTTRSLTFSTGSNYQGEEFTQLSKDFLASVKSGTVDEFVVANPEVLNQSQ